MKFKTRQRTLIWTIASVLAVNVLGTAQDWPQWRGPNRDGKAIGFKPPASWPTELKSKWKIDVGEGVATPALVGNRLFVFSRDGGFEVIRSIDVDSGKEHWQDKYEALGADGPARSFSGPRCSPAVSNGKVITIGVRGLISCLDAATGKVLWRKDDFQGAVPGFYTSSSPLITDELCIAQLGARGQGALVAYDLATGSEKWRCPGDPAYASPVLMNLDGQRIVVAQTEQKLLAVRAADGQTVAELASSPGGGRGGGPGGGRDYKAATPIVDGQTVFIAGRGTKALKLEKAGDGYAWKELWNNPDVAVQFNTPILKDGHLYGLTPGNDLFCVNAQTGERTWLTPTSQPGASPSPAPGGPGGGRGRGGGGSGFGSVADAGPVLIALTPASQLIVFEPNSKAFSEVARIKVADTPTHAHPILAGPRLIIKDQNSVALLVFE